MRFPPFRMMRILAVGALVALAAGYAAPALAQGQGAGAPVYQSWFPVGTPATLAVSNTSANVAFPTGGSTARICNTGASTAYVVLGTANSVVATTAAGSLIASGKCQAFNLMPFSTRYTYLAAITAASTTSLRIEAGLGSPIASDGTSSGGGSTTPGGSTLQLQYNNAGAFGGIAGAISDGTTVQFTDGDLLLENAAVTGGAAIHASTATGHTDFTLPSTTDTLAGLAATQTLSNKTFVAPVLGAATGTSLALGGATIGTDALAVTGTTSAGNLNVTAATVPTNGIYLSSANTVSISTSGAAKLTIGTTVSAIPNFAAALQSNNAAGFAFSVSAASSTVPVLIPNRTSTTTGFGAQAAGNLSAIVGGAENWRWTSTGPMAIVLPTDTGQTDSSLCVNTTSHIVYSGSGTLGVCLGTSSARYKNTIVSLDLGLDTILALKPKSYFYNADSGDGGARMQFGFLAEDALSVTPTLVGLDADNAPNTFDLIGTIPILVHAVQEQQAQIAALQAKVN